MINHIFPFDRVIRVVGERNKTENHAICKLIIKHAMSEYAWNETQRLKLHVVINFVDEMMMKNGSIYAILKLQSISCSTWVAQLSTGFSVTSWSWWSFQLIYWSCEDDNHLSLSTNSCKSKRALLNCETGLFSVLLLLFHSIRLLILRSVEFFFQSNCHNQSLSLPFDRKYVHCVVVIWWRAEDDGEDEEEEDETEIIMREKIIQRIHKKTLRGCCKRNSKKKKQEEKKATGEADWSVIIKNQSPNQIRIIMNEKQRNNTNEQKNQFIKSCKSFDFE